MSHSPASIPGWWAGLDFWGVHADAEGMRLYVITSVWLVASALVIGTAVLAENDPCHRGDGDQLMNVMPLLSGLGIALAFFFTSRMEKARGHVSVVLGIVVAVGLYAFAFLAWVGSCTA